MPKPSSIQNHYKDTREQLNAIRDEMNAVHDRGVELNVTAKGRALTRFHDAEGCMTCHGRGWVVTWDTMDFLDGSAADYGDCPSESCTTESRKTSGYYPENTRYDHNRGALWSNLQDLTVSEQDEYSSLNPQMEKLNQKYRDTELAAQPAKGKVVEVIFKSRSRNSAPIGAKGKVFWYGVNDWGTVKVGFLDPDGNKYWTTEKCVKVISQKAGKEYNVDYADQYPLLCKVVRKSNKAICVMTPGQTPFSHGEWIPWSQILNADQVREQIGNKLLKDGRPATVMIPPWLAKKKGYLRD